MARWPTTDEYRLPREARYQKIAAALRQEIRASRKTGDKVDPEKALAVRFGVGVNTVRQALAVLVQEGLLERRRGSGTFVRDLAEHERHIGILIELDIADPGCSLFWRRAVQALRERLEARGLPAHLYIGHVRAGQRPPEDSTCQATIY